VKPLAELAAAISHAPLSPERGGYTLTMRECAGAEEAAAVLEQEAEALGGEGARLHLGWGSFRNLDLAAARRSAAVLLLDVNLHQHRVWDAVRDALAGAADARAFIEQVVPRLPREPRLRQFADDTRGWLRGDLERRGSWLCEARPERFRHVRALFAAGEVSVGSLDLRGGSKGAARFERLAHALEALRAQTGLALDTLYISNLPWYLAQPQGFFGERHQPLLERPKASPLENVYTHLGHLAPLARWIVSAMRLRRDATPDNLQWLTETLGAEEFLASEAWTALGLPAKNLKKTRG
jgi:hypothetical protein